MNAKEADEFPGLSFAVFSGSRGPRTERKVLANAYYDPSNSWFQTCGETLSPQTCRLASSYTNDEDLLDAAMANMNDEDLHKVKNWKENRW